MKKYLQILFTIIAIALLALSFLFNKKTEIKIIKTPVKQEDKQENKKFDRGDNDTIPNMSQREYDG